MLGRVKGTVKLWQPSEGLNPSIGMSESKSQSNTLIWVEPYWHVPDPSNEIVRQALYIAHNLNGMEALHNLFP